MAPNRASTWSTYYSISRSTITRNREVGFAMVATGEKRNGLATVFSHASTIS